MLKYLPDWIVQKLMVIAYVALKCLWFVTRPSVEGVYVAVWWNSNLLVVKNSYRPGKCAPGGRLDAGEKPITGANRELFEETGILLSELELQPAGVFESHTRFHHDTFYFFEVELSEKPQIKLDNREVISAEFVTITELEQSDLIHNLEIYLQQQPYAPLHQRALDDQVQ